MCSNLKGNSGAKGLRMPETKPPTPCINSWSGAKLSKEIILPFYITFGGWY